MTSRSTCHCHDHHRVDAVLAAALDRLAELHEASLNRLADHHDARASADFDPLAEAIEFAIDRRALLGLPLPDDGLDDRLGRAVAEIVAETGAANLGVKADLLARGPVVAARLAETAIALRLDPAFSDAAVRLWRAASVLAGMPATPTPGPRSETPRTTVADAFDDLREILHVPGHPLDTDVEVALARMADAITIAGARERDLLAAAGVRGAATPPAEHCPECDLPSGGHKMSCVHGGQWRALLAADVRGAPTAKGAIESIIEFFAAAGVPCEVLVDAGPGGGTLRPRIGRPSAEQRERLDGIARSGGLEYSIIRPPASVVARTEGRRRLTITYPDGRSFALAYTVVGEDE